MNAEFVCKFAIEISTLQDSRYHCSSKNNISLRSKFLDVKTLLTVLERT